MAYYRQQLINTTIEFVPIIYKKDVSKKRFNDKQQIF